MSGYPFYDPATNPSDWTSKKHGGAEQCPMCGSENLEIDNPLPGEKTCRDCGEIIEADEFGPGATP